MSTYTVLYWAMRCQSAGKRTEDVRKGLLLFVLFEIDIRKIVEGAV